MSELSLSQFESDKEIQSKSEGIERLQEGISTEEQMKLVRKTKKLLCDILSDDSTYKNIGFNKD